MNTDELRFDEKGLIPAIVVDASSKKVLTLAYMNRESLEISIKEGRTCFWSRSRGELWRKGETSGNVQHIVSITADCDKDALIVLVEKDGPACHTGNDSCFFNELWSSPDCHPERGGGSPDCLGCHPERSEGSPVSPDCHPERSEGSPVFPGPGGFSLDGLLELIYGRKTEKKEGSYTSYLFEKGRDKILKKVGEESTEVIVAAKGGSKGETVYEIADLVYHVMVLMADMGISNEDILRELASRHVIDRKEKQETRSASSVK